MEEDWLRLADYVVTERVRRGLDLRGLATKTKVSERTLGKLENGQRVSRDTLAAIEMAFGWAPGTARSILLGGTPPAAPDETRSPAAEDGPGRAAGAAPADYPDWVPDDPFCRHIYDYGLPEAADDEVLNREKRFAIGAVKMSREAVSGVHHVSGQKRA